MGSGVCGLREVAYLCLLLYALYMVCRSSWQVADLCPLLYTVMADVAVDWTLVEWVSSAGWTWLGSAAPWLVIPAKCRSTL